MNSITLQSIYSLVTWFHNPEVTTPKLVAQSEILLSGLNQLLRIKFDPKPSKLLFELSCYLTVNSITTVWKEIVPKETRLLKGEQNCAYGDVSLRQLHTNTSVLYSHMSEVVKNNRGINPLSCCQCSNRWLKLKMTTHSAALPTHTKHT